MGISKRIIIFEETDSNLAGFQWMVRFSVHAGRQGLVVLSKFRSGEGWTVIGRFAEGDLLWEVLGQELEEEGYEIDWIDIDQTFKTLLGFSRDVAWSFATASLTEQERERLYSERLARILLLSRNVALEVIELWVADFRSPQGRVLRDFVSNYITKNGTLPVGTVDVTWNLKIDFGDIRRRLFEIDFDESSGLV